MFSVLFEVHPKSEQWDDYLGYANAAPRTGKGRRVCRQYPLPQPDARRLDPVPVGLARREVGGPLVEHVPRHEAWSLGI